MKLIIKNANFGIIPCTVETITAGVGENNVSMYSRYLASGNKIRITASDKFSCYLRVDTQTYTHVVTDEVITLARNYNYIQFYSNTALSAPEEIKLEIFGDNTLYNEKVISFQITEDNQFLPVTDINNGAIIAESTHTPAQGSFSLFMFDSSSTYLGDGISDNIVKGRGISPITTSNVAYLKAYGSDITTYGPYTHKITIWTPKS